MTHSGRLHLYVEKSQPWDRMLLLDFLDDSEFRSFLSSLGRETVRYDESGYEPSMLLLHGVQSHRRLPEGSMLTVDTESFAELIREYVRPRSEGMPVTTLMEAEVSSQLSEMLDYAELTVVDPDIYDATRSLPILSDPLLPSLGDLPDSNTTLTVWDVGQGSTNSICSGSFLTLFDFGTYIHSSYAETATLYRSLASFIHPALYERRTLIVSHWDLDHYNLLSVASDDFLKSLDYFCCPAGAFGRTATRILSRIQTLVRHVYVVSPASSHSYRRLCGVGIVSSGKNYQLSIGGQSKNKNLSGLMLSVFNDRSAALLTGDHSNHQVWDGMYTSLPNAAKNQKIHVVVPHHGGNRAKIAFPSGLVPGVAAISVNHSQYHYHPSPSMIQQYTDEKFDVKRTDSPPHNIRIHL